MYSRILLTALLGLTLTACVPLYDGAGSYGYGTYTVPSPTYYSGGYSGGGGYSAYPRHQSGYYVAPQPRYYQAPRQYVPRQYSAPSRYYQPSQRPAYRPSFNHGYQRGNSGYGGPGYGGRGYGGGNGGYGRGHGGWNR